MFIKHKIRYLRRQTTPFLDRVRLIRDLSLRHLIGGEYRLKNL